jgi:tetratricopeptide (TPR) repeat protein
MEDFIRTRNTGAFSEIRESTPFIIIYNPQWIPNYDNRLKDHNVNAIDILDKISGVHECCIINKGKNKKDKVVFQAFIEDLNVSISFSNTSCKWEVYLYDISLDRFVQPAGENEYKKVVLDIYVTESTNHDSFEYLENINKVDQRQAMKELLFSLNHINVPLRVINMEKDREMWQAYIDGQTAVNEDNKELYKVLSVGDFRKENNRTTVTLKLKATSLVDNVVKDLNVLLKNSFPDVDIDKKNDKLIKVTFPCYENLNEELINDISEKVSEKCFKFDGKLINELNADLHLSSKDDFQDILLQIDHALSEGYDAELKRFDGVYELADDDEVGYVKDYVEKAGFKNSVFTTITTSVDVSFNIKDTSLDSESDRIERKKLLRPLVRELIGNSKVKFNIPEGSAKLFPNSENDYNELVSTLKNLVPEELSVVISPYRPLVTVSLKTDDLDYCKGIYDSLRGSLYSIDPNIHLYCKNKELYQDFALNYKFEEEEQLNVIKEALQKEIQKYNSLVELSFGDAPNGITSFTVTLDSVQLQQFSSNIQREFKLQAIRLIDGEKYEEALEELDEALEEKENGWLYDDEIDDEIWSKRKAIAELIGKGSKNIGRCLSRTMDTVRFEVSDDFLKVIQSKEGLPKATNFIKVGDYIQFPLSGESAELSRQQESMYRITQPNTRVEIQGYTKRINAPANPLLSQFLFDPRYAGDPIGNIDDIIADIEKPGNHIENRMNKNQKRAVATAVAAPDFAIIQGPPGTGKTTVIAEIIWQEIRRNPKARILLTSQTNLAVDNALSRLKGKPGIRPVRILPPAKATGERLTFDEKRYLLNQITDWENSPNEDNSDNGVKLWINRIKNNICQDEKYENALSLWKQELESTDKMMRHEFVTAYKQNANLVAATCSICGSYQFRSKYAQLFHAQEEAFDVVIMDEASKATPLEMAVPMVWGKKIIVIGDHKQLPPMMQEGNILDALRRIGRKDLADRIEHFKESQFELLYEASAKLKNSLVASLNEQYRMHEQIMNTINHFYKDNNNDQEGLICGIKQDMDIDDPNNGGSRYHGMTLEPFINPDRHVLWVDVPDLEDQQAPGSTSRTNKAEVEAIALVIKALKKSTGFNEFMEKQKTKEDKEIGIITFYGAQAALIEEMKSKGKLDPAYNYRINVVDKFQGMERNIVIISTVRNNNYTVNPFGFTSDPRRINVGFSRAKCLLIIVGNRSFLSKNADYAKAIAAIGNNRIDVQTLKHLVKNG